MKRGSVVLLLTLLLQCPIGAQRGERRMDEWEALKASLVGARSVEPRQGFVPTQEAAVQVADAVAVAQYGEGTISRERPLKARLFGTTWFVMGTLHPEGAYGGTVVVKLSKKDGRVLFMTHQE